MKQALRRLPGKMFILSTVAMVTSTATMIDGLVEGDKYQKKLTPEAVKQYPDATSQEELANARQIIDAIDAQLLQNRANEIRRQRAMFQLSDAKNQEALMLLNRQASIQEDRNKFIAENTPPRLAYQSVIGGLGALPVSVAGMALSLVARIRRQIKELKRTSSANSPA